MTTYIHNKQQPPDILPWVRKQLGKKINLASELKKNNVVIKHLPSEEPQTPPINHRSKRRGTDSDNNQAIVSKIRSTFNHSKVLQEWLIIIIWLADLSYYYIIVCRTQRRSSVYGHRFGFHHAEYFGLLLGGRFQLTLGLSFLCLIISYSRSDSLWRARSWMFTEDISANVYLYFELTSLI